MQEFLDYMGAAVGVVLIFVSAAFYMSAFAAGGIAYNTQQNQAAQAQNLLDYILGSTGSPPNWGDTSNYPEAFGLQETGAPPYTVDPFKAIRLLETQPCTLPNSQKATCIFTGIEGFYFFYPTPPYYVPYSYTRSLVEAQADFEFQLRLTPALNVSIGAPKVGSGGGGYTYTFPVRVYSAFGAPVADAEVNATFFAAKCGGKGGGCAVTLYITTASNTTNTGGLCQLRFTTPTYYKAYSVVASVTVSGIRGVGFYTNPAQNRLVYVEVAPQTRNITVVRACITTPCSVAYPNITTYVFTPKGLEEYTTCTSPRLTTGEGFEEVVCSGLPIQGLVAVGLANSNCNGESGSPNCVEEALIAPVDVFGSFGLNLVYGGPNNQGPGYSSISVTATRTVVIGGFTYVASITYWPDYGPVYGG